MWTIDEGSELIEYYRGSRAAYGAFIDVAEKEGVELLMPSEGLGSGEEPGDAAVKRPEAWGKRDAVKAGDGTGPVCFRQGEPFG